MRNDLVSLSYGRCMAQASHATNAFMKDYGNNQAVKDWQKETSQGFGTCIVLAANIDKIKEIHSKVKRKYFCGLVVDPDYVVRIPTEIYRLMKNKSVLSIVGSEKDNHILITRKEITCSYIFGSKDELFPYLGELSLY